MFSISIRTEFDLEVCGGKSLVRDPDIDQRNTRFHYWVLGLFNQPVFEMVRVVWLLLAGAPRNLTELAKANRCAPTPIIFRFCIFPNYLALVQAGPVKEERREAVPQVSPRVLAVVPS